MRTSAAPAGHAATAAIAIIAARNPMHPAM
jgi:hypothetical protein